MWNRNKYYLRCRQARRAETNFREFSQRIQVTLVFRKIRRVGVWAADRWRAFIDRCKGHGTDLEVGKFIVGDLNSIPWVAFPSCYTLPRLIFRVSNMGW